MLKSFALWINPWRFETPMLVIDIWTWGPGL